MSEEPEIRVKDSRRFTAEGDAKPDAPADKPASAPPPEPAASQPKAEAKPEPDSKAFAPPPATFELLTYSLVMQAEMSLMGQGEGEGEAPDLAMARHAIDMLGVLKDKTKGNLSLEENRLLENSLTELRFRYVQIQGELTRPGGGS